MISTKSFLFAPHCDSDALYELLARATPAIYIGNDIETIRGKFEEDQAWLFVVPLDSLTPSFSLTSS